MGPGVLLRRRDDRGNYQQYQGFCAGDGLFPEADGSKWQQPAGLCVEGWAEGFPCAGDAESFEESCLILEKMWAWWRVRNRGFADVFEGGFGNVVRSGGVFVVSLWWIAR